MESGGRLVLLDACCLLNLFATGHVGQILETSPHRFAVARYVAEEEILEIDSPEGEQVRTPLQPRIDELVEADCLELLEVSTAREQRELVRFAFELDDGEAHTLALAVIRKARVATDDKKAIRIYSEESPVGCLRTSDLLFEWAEAEEIPEPELRRIVRAIAHRASFFPPRSDPHFERWMNLLRGGC